MILRYFPTKAEFGIGPVDSPSTPPSSWTEITEVIGVEVDDRDLRTFDTPSGHSLLLDTRVAVRVISTDVNGAWLSTLLSLQRYGTRSIWLRVRDAVGHYETFRNVAVSVALQPASADAPARAVCHFNGVSLGVDDWHSNYITDADTLSSHTFEKDANSSTTGSSISGGVAHVVASVAAGGYARVSSNAAVLSAASEKLMVRAEILPQSLPDAIQLRLLRADGASRQLVLITPQGSVLSGANGFVLEAVPLVDGYIRVTALTSDADMSFYRDAPVRLQAQTVGSGSFDFYYRKPKLMDDIYYTS